MKHLEGYHLHADLGLSASLSILAELRQQTDLRMPSFTTASPQLRRGKAFAATPATTPSHEAIHQKSRNTLAPETSWMARLLQKSNQPTTNAGSWGGFFSCCFSSPKEEPLAPPVIPAIKVQPPRSETKAAPPQEAPKRPDSSNPVGAEAMYNSWMGKSDKPRSTSHENIPLATVAQGGPGTSHPPSPHGSFAPGTIPEFTEEAYPKGYNWQNTGEQVARRTAALKVLGSMRGPRTSSSTPSSPRRSVTIKTANDWARISLEEESLPSLPMSPLSIKTHRSSRRTNSLRFPLEESPKDHHQQQQQQLLSQWRFRISGLVGGLNAPTNATINTHIKINHQTAELSVAVRQVENAPGEGNAGSPAYQVRIAIVGLKKKKRWHSATVAAPNPQFNETAVFKNMTPDELSKAALRFRLYGCKKMRRHYIFAESIIAFPVFNLHGGEADIPVALESKVGHGSVVDSDSDSGDNLSRLHASNPMGSRLSMRSSASKHSGTASRLSLRRRQPPTPTGAAQPELDIARQVAEGREANWPELHCGLAYNVTTKRLQVSVLRANRLRIPEASLRSPKATVSVSLLSSTGEKIDSSQTHDVKLSACTEFGEKFAFDMSSLDPREVTVFFRVMQKRHVHKNEVLGWFALGSRNTGEEERNHWNEMLQAQGQEITRWHILNENVQ